MKMTLDVDCTPAEAREFLGLPDLRPMQSAIHQRLEQRMSASLDELSPAAVSQECLFLGSGGSTRYQEFFDGLFGRVARDGAADRKDAKQP